MSLFVTKNNPTDLWLSSKVVNDAYDRFRVQADGKILWANGANDQDTQLARTNQNELSIFTGDGSTNGNLNLNSARLADDVPQIDLNNLQFPSPYKNLNSLGYGNILFKHTGSQHNYPDDVYTSLFLVMVQDPAYQNNYLPILATDHGLWVEKDIQTYGALFTSSDPGKSYGGGAILMGHGFTGPGSPPRISLTDSELVYQSGTSFPPNPTSGQCFNRTDLGHLYRYDGSQWIEAGPICTGYFNTLFLKKADGSTPATLNLGKLEVQSTNSVFAVTAGDNGVNQDTYLIPQNPSQGGLGLGTANYPFKWVDATTVFTNGINCLSGGTINVYCNIITTNGNVTINKAIPILQLKATSGDPIIEFYDTSTLKMNLAYSAAGDYFYLRDIVGSKDVFQATHAGQLALPVNGSTGGLRIGDDAYLYRGSTNTLYVYRNIEPGADSDTGYLGEGGRYWYGLVANYIYYRTAIQFDEYDDLAIAKLWGEKNQTLPADYDKTKLEPPTDDPFKIIKGSKDKANTEEFFDVGKVNGFLMGCVKALAKKQDEHDALLLKLLNEVESLRAEIAS